MFTKKPQITPAGDWRSGRYLECVICVWLRFRLFEDEVDFGDFEAGHSDLEAQIDCDEVLQFDH